MSRVLVTGSNGPIGRAVLVRLPRHDLTPVAAVGDAAGDVVALDRDVLVGERLAVDMQTHRGIRSALDDITAVIHAADIGPGGSDSIPDTTRAMATACAETGVHLVFASRVGSDLSSLKHRKALWQAEQIVESTTNLAYTIQRVTHSHPGLASLLVRPVLPLPAGTPVQPVSPHDIAGRLVGLAQAGPSARVRDFGGPELMSLGEAAAIHRQVRGTSPRRVPLPRVGAGAEALDGVHVTRSGDRGHETFRSWLKNNR